ncbi:hypothetical protein BN109_005 [Yersinia phage phi80-18]|uniref:Uncharacterized protein n=1 Tax=Yersinia phage phi80-18 TaxID=1206559 RepID=I7LHC2_9CAUD|nr:hypothetical protein BN109_005 [Yersinia phage phi80-18]CCI88844.2 hypothetical protein BN109_005 [Yersinia phage phi80-18]
MICRLKVGDLVQVVHFQGMSERARILLHGKTVMVYAHVGREHTSVRIKPVGSDTSFGSFCIGEYRLKLVGKGKDMSKLFAVGSYVKYVGVPVCPRITALLKDCTGVVVCNMVHTIEVKWLNATGEYAARNGKHITEALKQKAPEYGPVLTCNEDFNATTVAAAQLGEVLRYLPFQNYSAPVVDYIRKVGGGIWFHFSNDVYRDEAVKATGAVIATGSNWVYFSKSSWFVQTATWLGDMHGNFVPAFEWPSFPRAMETAFNNCYLNGAQQ